MDTGKDRKKIYQTDESNLKRGTIMMRKCSFELIETATCNDKFSLITRKTVLVVLFVLLLGLVACSSKKESVTENSSEDDIYKPKHNVFFEIQSLTNKKNKNDYDVVICIDGNEIGTVPSGKLFTKKIVLTEGEHELSILKLGRDNLKDTEIITISKDITYCCDVKHKGASIKIKIISTKDGIEDSEEIVVGDYSDMVLADAMSQLKQNGFVNVNVKSDEDITDENAWMVVNQNENPGIAVDRRIPIILDCMPIDEYLIHNYKGKSLFEIEELGEKSGFIFNYVSYPNEKELNKRVKADLELKEDKWKIIDIKKQSGKKINLLLSYADKASNPYQEVISLTETHDPSSANVYIGDNMTVTIKASPAGLTKEDFDFSLSNNNVSYSVKEISNLESSNITIIYLDIIGKLQGNSVLTVKSNYDILEAYDSELSISVSITVNKKEPEKPKEEEKPKQEEKPKEVEKPNQQKPKAEVTPEPTVPSANIKSGYYITPTGEKYHRKATCAGDNCWEGTWKEIQDRNLEPCGRCCR